MTQVIRLISYEFEDEDALEKQLGKSMPDGIRQLSGGNQIRVLTIPERFVRLIGEMAQQIDEQSSGLMVIGELPGDYQADQRVTS